jgi:xanthine dehydrogenase accessory factor
MLDIAADLLDSLGAGRRLAVATITTVDGSAPRALGTSMAVDDRGRVIGSISGGCVEGAVYQAAEGVLETGEPVLAEFGFTDGDAFAAGLSCGGRIEVFVHEVFLRGVSASGVPASGIPAGGTPAGGNRAGGNSGSGNSAGEDSAHEDASGARGVLDERVLRELEAARDGRPAGIAIIVAGAGAGTVLAAAGSARGLVDAVPQSEVLQPEVLQSEVPQSEGLQSEVRQGGVLSGDGIERHGLERAGLERDGLDPAAAQRILHELAARVSSGRSGTVDIDCDGEVLRVLFMVASTAPRMIIFGAVDFSAALAEASSLLGYHVTVCDARPLFATPRRFPSADEVVVAWPSEYLRSTPVDDRTVICVLTHDEKFDIPLLDTALRLPVAFVGAMASRTTHERRIRALEEAGLDSAQLERLHSPIGLDLGGSTPEETAVSILAEVIASRTGSTGVSLRLQTGPIHRSASDAGLSTELASTDLA